MTCEYTVLPQEMTSSFQGAAAGCCRSDAAGLADGRRTGECPPEDEERSGRWYSCNCRRLPPASAAPRPPDTIAYLSGSVDRQPGSWRPLTDEEDADEDSHRHCTCTSGRCRQPPSLTAVSRRTLDPEARRRQLACYVIASTSDDDDSAAATGPPDVQTLAPSVVLTQH